MKPVRWFPLAVLLALHGGVARGAYLYVSDSDANVVKRFDAATGIKIDTFIASPGPLDHLGSLAFGPDGNIYIANALVGHGKVAKFDARTGASLGLVVAEGSGGLTSSRLILFGPDGNLYILDSADPYGGGPYPVRKYDGRTGAALGVFVADAGLPAQGNATFGPDGDLYVSDSNVGAVRRFDGETGAAKPLFVAPSGGLVFMGIAFGPDGNLYVASPLPQNQIRVYDGASGLFLRAISTPTLGFSYAPRFLPNGNLLLPAASFPPGGLATLSPAGVLSLSFIPNAEVGGSSGTALACEALAGDVCLGLGRFRVRAAWRTAQGQTGMSHGVRYSDDTGQMWFFSASNLEAIVKVLNGCALNQRYWLFAGGLTNVNVTLTAFDTVGGATKTYTNPQGHAFQPIQDTGAFATCP